MTHRAEWTAYLLGAVMALVVKLGRYLMANYKAWVAREKLAQGVERTADLEESLHWSWKKALLEWFFEGSVDNAASWAATIGVVWMLGTMYIDRIDWLFGEMTAKVPLHASFAFTLGYINEFVSPDVIKWLVGKVTPKS